MVTIEMTGSPAPRRLRVVLQSEASIIELNFIHTELEPRTSEQQQQEAMCVCVVEN